MDTVNSLEKCIVDNMQAKSKNRLSRRFIVDDEKILLAFETDEQAGVVELTEDYACAFKAEPVYSKSVDEIAGKVAAGSGKLYREMSVCGSQPVCTLLSLTTGESSTSSELQKAVTDMAAYSNTYGIPVAGGDMRFKNSQQKDIAANLLTIGLIDKDKQFVSSCCGAGNPVYIVGAPDSCKQIATDAFFTRSMHELICDLHDDDAIVAVQTIGDSAIALASSEEMIIDACAKMVVAGNNGIELNISKHLADRFPTSTGDRLIMILRKNYAKKFEKACHKWNMRSVNVGVVTKDHKLTVVKDQKIVADLPAHVLNPDFEDANFCFESSSSDVVQPETSNLNSEIQKPDTEIIAKQLPVYANLSSQQWIFEQFDSTIGTNNLSTNFISDAAVFQIKGTQHALAASFCQNNSDLQKYPESVNIAIAEALHKVVCSGGVPRCLTGCLNYGGNISENILNTININIAEFCKKAGIASSGISMNNAAPEGEPAIFNFSVGAVAFLNDKQLQMTMSFKGKGDMIYMLGNSLENINSSEYIRNYHDVKDSQPQRVYFDEEIKLMNVAQHLIARKLVNSAQAVSRGGLFMALLKASMVRSLGFDITTDDEIRKDAFLFGEAPSRIIVSVASSREASFIDYMIRTNAPFISLGHVTREEIRIDDNSYGFISDYKKRYHA